MTFRPGKIPNRKRALYALGMLMFFGIGLLTFTIAANEQSVLGSGRPEADRISLQDLMTRGNPGNKHIELADYYFGKQFIYTAKLIQFQDVYVPVFVKGQPEDGAHLQVLVWIRNDRNSNQGLIQSYQELDQLVADYNRNPRTISGVLVRPISRVKALTLEAYPGTNAAALQVLWARDFPDPSSMYFWWGLMAGCFVAAGACLVAFRRTGKAPRYAGVSRGGGTRLRI